LRFQRPAGTGHFEIYTIYIWDAIRVKLGMWASVARALLPVRAFLERATPRTATPLKGARGEEWLHYCQTKPLPRYNILAVDERGPQPGCETVDWDQSRELRRSGQRNILRELAAELIGASRNNGLP
jgi:hypothetical protein